MQNVICFLLLIGISTNFLFGQSIPFDIPENMYDGPLIEISDENLMVYSWYKKPGFKFRKHNSDVAQADNDEAVFVEILQVQTFSNKGEFISKEDFPIQLKATAKDNGSLQKFQEDNLIEEYDVSDGQEIFKDERTIFATSDDMTFEAITAKFPKSVSTKEENISPETADVNVRTTAYVRGKGMPEGKKPYMLTIKKSGEIGNFEVELKDIPTNNPDAEWKNAGTSIEIDLQNPAVPVWYNKWITNDKFNHFKAYKLVIYDNEGQMIQEKDMNFTKPNKIYQTTKVTTTSGEVAGQLYFFSELFGSGFKKANPEPNKKGNTIIFVSKDGKTIEEIELIEGADKDRPGAPEAIAAVKTDQGITLFLHTDKRKKEKIARGMVEYNCVDGTATLVNAHDYKALVKNTSGEFSNKFSMNAPDFEAHHKITNNNTLHIGVASNSADKNTLAKSCNYIITDSNGSILQLGEIETGNMNTENKPTIKIDALESDRLLVTIAYENLGNKLWVFDGTKNNFSPVSTKKIVKTKKTIRKNNVIYFIGTGAVEGKRWFIEKNQL